MCCLAEQLFVCSLYEILVQDEQYYKKAWEVSAHKSARAQRSLGMLYLRQKKVTRCSLSDCTRMWCVGGGAVM